MKSITFIILSSLIISLSLFSSLNCYSQNCQEDNEFTKTLSGFFSPENCPDCRIFYKVKTNGPDGKCGTTAYSQFSLEMCYAINTVTGLPCDCLSSEEMIQLSLINAMEIIANKNFPMGLFTKAITSIAPCWERTSIPIDKEKWNLEKFPEELEGSPIGGNSKINAIESTQSTTTSEKYVADWLKPCTSFSGCCSAVIELHYNRYNDGTLYIETISILQAPTVTTECQNGYCEPMCNALNFEGYQPRKGNSEIESTETVGLFVYPNPTNGILNIESYNHQEGTTIEILDYMGNIAFVSELNTEQNIFRFDLSNLSNGYYHYRLINSCQVLKQGDIIISK